MTGRAPTPVIVLATHARTVPAIKRERFAQRLHADLGGGALILETCHRVEAYLIGGGPSAAAALLPEGGHVLTGDCAVRHAITVALQAGRRARSWRQGPPPSLADLALLSIERQGSPIRGRQLLIVGAGRMGRLAANAAAQAGASVTVANRSRAGAETLASATPAEVAAFDPRPAIARFAGVVVALSGPWPIGATAIDALALDKSHAPALAGTPADRLDQLIDRTAAEYLDWQKGREGRALAARADRAREPELRRSGGGSRISSPASAMRSKEMTRHLAERLPREPIERLGRDTDGREERAIRDIFAL